MITAIFSRCLNLIWLDIPTAKTGVHIAHSRLGVWFYFIAKQSVRMIITVSPGRGQMMPRYAHLLTLIVLDVLVSSGACFCPNHRQLRLG